MSVFPRVKFTVEEEEEEDEEQGSGLLVELEGKDEKKEREANLWFSKVQFIVWCSSWQLHKHHWSTLTFEPAVIFSLQGIFSEIDLEGDAESELQQSEWLQNKQKGNSLTCFSFINSHVYKIDFNCSFKKKGQN